MVRNHIKYLARVSLFVIIAGSPVVSETPKLHKLLLRGRAVVARKAHNLEVAGSIPAPATKISQTIAEMV